MSDGHNQTRASRITELMTDYRNIQNYIASIRANPSAEEYNEDGYVLLRQCVAAAQALLTQPFPTSNGSNNSDEDRKAQLRRIITDAAVRRFRAKKIYLRATAALRWVNARAAVLQGQTPHAGHVAFLQQIRSTLHSEVASITDQRVEMVLRSADTKEGKWLVEDPPLQVILRLAGNGNGNGNGRGH